MGGDDVALSTDAGDWLLLGGVVVAGCSFGAEVLGAGALDAELVTAAVAPFPEEVLWAMLAHDFLPAVAEVVFALIYLVKLFEEQKK